MFFHTLGMGAGDPLGLLVIAVVAGVVAVMRRMPLVRCLRQLLDIWNLNMFFFILVLRSIDNHSLRIISGCCILVLGLAATLQ